MFSFVVNNLIVNSSSILLPFMIRIIVPPINAVNLVSNVENYIQDSFLKNPLLKQ